MKRKYQRLIAILLTIIILLPTVAYAENTSDYLCHNISEYLGNYISDETSCPIDIFNVTVTPGMYYSGYSFHLIDGATFSLEDSENIRVISLTLNLFHAATIQDIINFVAPEMIVFIEPNYRTTIPMP
ncbi:MAG: hypothetical protein FWC92_08575 [Defluviitaleaceae bacterium]|nr:hypothetical protein [Defluviitaleaceae bacterium]